MIYFLYGLLILLLLIFLIICIKIKVQLKLNDKIEVFVYASFVKIKVFPFKKKAKKPSKTKKQTKEQDEEKEKINYLDHIDDILDIVYDFRDSLIIEKLYVNIMLATDDSCKTGLLLGRVSAVAANIWSFLSANFKISKSNVNIDADFLDTKIKKDCDIIINTRIIKTLFVLMKNYKKIKKLI